MTCEEMVFFHAHKMSRSYESCWILIGYFLSVQSLVVLSSASKYLNRLVKTNDRIWDHATFNYKTTQGESTSQSFSRSVRRLKCLQLEQNSYHVNPELSNNFFNSLTSSVHLWKDLHTLTSSWACSFRHFSHIMLLLCPRLVSLETSQMPYHEVPDFLIQVGHLRCLERLVIKTTSGYSRDNMHKFGPMLELPRLTLIHIDAFPWLHDEFIAMHSERLARLEDFTIRGSGKVTASNLRHFGNVRSLKIDISSSYQIDSFDTLLDGLIRLPLESLSIGSCVSEFHEKLGLRFAQRPNFSALTRLSLALTTMGWIQFWTQHLLYKGIASLPLGCII